MYLPRQQKLPVTVLIVDDDKCTLALLSIFLEKEGHQIVTADSVQQGIAALKQYQPTIVITDICMPRVSGLDMIRTIRSFGDFLADTPIIALSAGSDDTLMAAEDAGATVVARKPDDMRRIPFLIQQILHTRCTECEMATTV